MPEYQFFQNMCFAINVNAITEKEKIVTGCSKNVYEYLTKSAVNGVDVTEREIGSFLYDLSSGCNMLDYYNSNCTEIPKDNVTCNYLKLLIDNTRSNPDITENERNMLITELKITQHSLIEEVFEDFQRHLSSKIYSTQIAEYILNRYDVNGISAICINDYAVTDISMLGMAAYYICILYSQKLYPRHCMECKSLFLSGKRHGNVLCSEKCRRKKKSQNTMAYYGKLSENEALYNKLYRKWKQRIDRAEIKGKIDTDALTLIKHELSVLTQTNRKFSDTRKMACGDTDLLDERHKAFLMGQDKLLYELFNQCEL